MQFCKSSLDHRRVSTWFNYIFFFSKATRLVGILRSVRGRRYTHVLLLRPSRNSWDAQAYRIMRNAADPFSKGYTCRYVCLQSIQDKSACRKRGGGGVGQLPVSQSCWQILTFVWVWSPHACCSNIFPSVCPLYKILIHVDLLLHNIHYIYTQ